MLSPGFIKKAEDFHFFEIIDDTPNAATFCSRLSHLTPLISTGEVVAIGRAAASQRNAETNGQLLEIAFTNIAFSAVGLSKV